MRVKIMGRYYELVFKFLRKAFGYCHRHPKNLIEVHNKLGDKKKLEVVIHECTHAANWHLDEEFVQEYAADLTEIIWRLGYRLAETEEN